MSYPSRTSHPPRLTPCTLVVPQLNATPLVERFLAKISNVYIPIPRRPYLASGCGRAVTIAMKLTNE